MNMLRRPVYVALGLTWALLSLSTSLAASSTVTARHGDLALRLTASVHGAVVHADAALTNTGNRPWEYVGGCTSPIVQIQARDVSGHVYGWQPTRIRCYALADLSLAAGQTIRVRSAFAINRPTHVWAQVPDGGWTKRLFRTRSVIVLPVMPRSRHRLTAISS
jgi:hypothetical protein